ncbi:YkgJ family cysteine cluster protein [Natrialbaceae archaeon GCM10025810]|uniref:YkgJ family cysteine cluster protein n=1 Tax=Halovalidus salilacus TaxID=3075124 RepID=UPI00361119F9
MEVNCEGCAGCCLDWRPLLEDLRDGEDDGTEGDDGIERDDEGVLERGHEHERRGPYEPLDDVYNLVPLTRDEVRRFLEAGFADALTPRLWVADAESGHAVEIDGRRVTAIGGRPAFFVGLRKPPKPVAPFGREAEVWLSTCTFLDPTTLQCRIHGGDLFPDECATYPGYNLALEQETECERVEATFGGDRLVSDDPPADAAALEGLLLGPGALGQKVFCHPRPDDLEGVVERAATDALTAEDRAEFVAVAAASSLGTLGVSDRHYAEARERALEADSWVGRSIREWERLAAEGDGDEPIPPAGIATDVEEDRGAPGTPGWE